MVFASIEFIYINDECVHTGNRILQLLSTLRETRSTIR